MREDSVVYLHIAVVAGIEQTEGGGLEQSFSVFEHQIVRDILIFIVGKPNVVVPCNIDDFFESVPELLVAGH